MNPMTTFARRAALVSALLVFSIGAGLASAEIGTSGQFQSAFSSFLGAPALVGDFQIVSEDDRSYLEFGAGFKAKSAPDLKVFLSRKAPDSVTGENATKSAVRLGLLMKFEGSQRYEIPAGTDLAVFSTVIVQCEQYAKLWGTGVLR